MQMKDIKEERQEIHSIQAEIIQKDYIIVSLKWKKSRYQANYFP